MRYLIPAALLAAFLLSTQASAAAGPPDCGDREDILDVLTEKYGEAVIGAGAEANGYIVELLVSPGGDTWSLLVSDDYGYTCYLGTGLDWKISPPPEPAGQGT